MLPSWLIPNDTELIIQELNFDRIECIQASKDPISHYEVFIRHGKILLSNQSNATYHYHCADCGTKVTRDEYPYHNPDHSLRKVEL